MPKKFINRTFVIIGACFLFVALTIAFLLTKLGLFEKSYSKKDLIENLDTKQRELAELKTYVNSIVPTGTTIHIEFDSKHTLGIFHLTDLRATSTEAKYNQNWNLKVTAEKTQSLLAKLGWTTETLLTLQEKLAAANCIAVETGEPFTIGFQRSGMGMYFYKLFNHELSEGEIKRYNDGCQYLYYKGNIVLEYQGGAIGPQCFPKRDNQ